MKKLTKTKKPRQIIISTVIRLSALRLPDCRPWPTDDEVRAELAKIENSK